MVLVTNRSLDMFIVYILYSNSIDKYYVGYTNDLERRLLEHNRKKREIHQWWYSVEIGILLNAHHLFIDYAELRYKIPRMLR